MATIEIGNENLVVHIHGWDVVLALRSTLTIPLAHIRDVVATPPDAQYDKMKGLRLAGGYVPHAFAAGYFWVTGASDHAQQHALDKLEAALHDLAGTASDAHFRANEVRSHIEAAATGIRDGLRASGAAPLSKYLAFYDVHKPERTIGLDVEHGRLRRVVVEIDNETPDEAVRRIKSALGK